MKYKNIIFISIGYILLYGTFEILSRLLEDNIVLNNSLFICAVIITLGVLIEKIFFKQTVSGAISKLGLKLPYTKGLIAAISISLLLFLFYPVITQITGYIFRIPLDWIFLGAGVFISHGICEELIFRGFLFRHIRERVNGFWKAAFLSVPFFAAAHLPIMISQGMLVGGMAFLLAVASSFPLAYLFERSGNSIIPPAIVHFAIDTIIPILSFAGANSESQIPTVYWMLVSMIIPYLAFVILRGKAKKKYEINI